MKELNLKRSRVPSLSRVAVVATAVACVIAALPGAGSAAPARSPSWSHSDRAQDGLAKARAQGRIDDAELALWRAATLFDLDAVRARFPGTARPDPHVSHSLLHDLVVHKDELDGEERRIAEAILARPTDGSNEGIGLKVPKYRSYTKKRSCLSIPVCVHWSSNHPTHKPPATDVDGNGKPDQIDLTIATLKTVWAKEISNMGFRKPKSDKSSKNNGGSGDLDVYLGDLANADNGTLFGYCTTDDPAAANNYDWSAYCVIDNDYTDREFQDYSQDSPANLLRVTVAHEFFHAVQYAYDALDDKWFKEGTAAWIEDEVFDEVNDNVNYLPTSPMGQSLAPLDYGDDLFQYGNWIWWRYVSERFGSAIVKQSWTKADAATASAPDNYGLQAIANVLAGRGFSLKGVFSDFAVANVHPNATDYEEAASYPGTKPVLEFALSPSAPTVPKTGGPIDHMAHGAFRFTSEAPVAGDELALQVNLPAPSKGSRAIVVSRGTSGVVTRKAIDLNTNGDGNTKVGFGPEVTAVTLLLINQSSKFTCWVAFDSPFSCLGVPAHDGETYAFNAALQQQP